MLNDSEYEDWYFSETVTTWEEVREMLAQVEQRREQGEEVMLRLRETSSKRSVIVNIFDERELEEWLNGISRWGMKRDRENPEIPLSTEVEARIASTKFLDLQP